MTIVLRRRQFSGSRFSIKAIRIALCVAICLASAAPAAFAKNDHGDCNGNCVADPAPAPLLGGGLMGLLVLAAGAAVIHRRTRRG